MYLLPPLPILQMPGRGNAHHLGTRTSPLMTSIRTPVYPPNTTIPRPPPQKAASPVRKALILRTFCPSGTKIGRHFGGIYRLIFRVYRWKNGIFPPLYPIPHNPILSVHLRAYCPSTLSFQLSFHTEIHAPKRRSSLWPLPLPYYTTNLLFCQPKSAPYSL